MPARRPAARALPLRLEDLPNVGRAVAADFRRLGIETPDEIRGRDPYMLYHDLCRATRALVDPCMLDTFIAVVRYVDGGPAKPWWHYTAERKRVFPGSAKALAAKRDVANGPADSKTVGPRPKAVGPKPDPQASSAPVGGGVAALARGPVREAKGDRRCELAIAAERPTRQVAPCADGATRPRASARRSSPPSPRRPFSDPAEA